MNVLIVDDSSTARLAWVMEFTKHTNIKPFTAGTGKSACDILKNNKIDVLVTDYDMPEMNGLELVNYFTKCSSNTIIFVVSSLDNATLKAQFKWFNNVHVHSKERRDLAIKHVLETLDKLKKTDTIK